VLPKKGDAFSRVSKSLGRKDTFFANKYPEEWGVDNIRVPLSNFDVGPQNQSPAAMSDMRTTTSDTNLQSTAQKEPSSSMCFPLQARFASERTSTTTTSYKTRGKKRETQQESTKYLILIC
jgi:hypothetical protein